MGILACQDTRDITSEWVICEKPSSQFLGLIVMSH
jgi:hypothetical protein